MTVTPTATTVTGPQTTVIPAKPTEWIRIKEVKPVDYYLSLLFSNGTAPYGQLYWQLRKLPSLTNATAVAKITYLALNATNPEVKEAFELMIKGGIPYLGDFKYSVPDYNTELQVLYWLACQSEFKKGDTLALAVAMTHGLWVTMGDEQVKDAVRRDINDLLAFFRETNDKQRQAGCSELEDYPLEAKLCLTWTGSITPYSGEYGLSKERWSNDYTQKKLDIKAYRWDAVNVTTLRSMQEIIQRKQWLNKDVNEMIARIEYYFYFEGRRRYGDAWRSNHWIYCNQERNNGFIELGGEKHRNWRLFAPNHQFDFYLQNDYVTGSCLDETVFIGAWAKSWGISTTAMWSICNDPNVTTHAYSIYYDPSDKSWKAYGEQLAWYVVEPGGLGVKHDLVLLLIFKPPMQQKEYLRIFTFTIPPDISVGNMFTTFQKGFTLASVRGMFSDGVPTAQMRQWLFYS